MAEDSINQPVDDATEAQIEAENYEDNRTEPSGKPVALKILKWIAIGVAALLLLLVAIVLGLNTGPGRSFAVNQINNLELASGLDINIERIDGSLYGDMTVVGLTLSDPKGVFATSPEVRVDWRPFKFVTGNLLDIRTLSTPQVRLGRLPELIPSEDDSGPLLPGFDIDVDTLDVRQLILEEPVAGRRSIASLAGSVTIKDQVAKLMLDAKTLRQQGLAGGDVIQVKLDAAPEQNRLAIDLNLDAPADGLVNSFANLDQPIRAQLKGAGDWQRWDGKLLANLGADRFAAIDLAARDGTFRVRGETNPGLLTTGPTQALLSPITRIDVTTKVDNSRYDLAGTVSSDNFALTADGLIDLGKNAFDDFTLDFLLNKPSTLAENLSGRGIRANLVLDGDFRTPAVAYKLNAAALGFNDIVVERLSAEGSATVKADRILIPVNATAARITGLNATAGELLTNVRLNGDIAVDGPRILSDSLRIRSDRLQAEALIIANLDTGLYTGALQGQLNNYRIDSVGVIDINTQADLRANNQGGFTLGGKVRVRTTQIFNESARDFLGGDTLISTDFAFGSDGVARLRNLNVASPAFRLTGGSGSYSPDGQIAFSGQGVSRQYGPLGLRVTGTMTNPTAVLTADRPGFGIGLANFQARVNGSNAGYAVLAKGDTDYGPFDADLTVITGNALTIDIARANFAGVVFDGRVQQTAAGPFAGRLNANGSGINGVVQLASVSGVQQAVIDARANNARLPGKFNVSIGRAIIDATVTLYDQPSVVADVQFANTNYGELNINAARAKVNYQGGNGTAQIYAEGLNSVPFRIAANADLKPDLWRIALDGRANSIDFKTKNPARIIPGEGKYRLQPTTILLSSGSLQLAGQYGNGLTLQSRLNDVDLSIANSIAPGLGLGGKANGSLDFNQASDGSFPSADARISIKRFTRTSLSAVSTPVDVNFVGKLLPNVGDARAVLRQGSTVIGRMVATLNPLPPGSGSWVTRVLAAPLGGGIRYNGPGSTLFSFAAVPNQTLKGTIGLAADFSGRVQRPQLTGLVRANDLTYENEVYGTRLSQMKLAGTFTNDRFQLDTLRAVAGNGTVSGSGYVSLSSDAGFPLDLKLNLDDARLARSDNISSTATGDIRITNQPGSNAKIAGTIRLPETRYKVIRQGGAQVPVLTGVRRKPPLGRQKVTGDAQPGAGLPTVFDLAVNIKADDQIYISGMGLESEWATDLRITGTTANPAIAGEVSLVRGTYGFAGNSFELTEGQITFNGGELTNPTIKIAAESDVDGVTAILNVTGRAQNPQIAFTSTPALPQDEIISRILFGSSVANLSAIQAVQLASSLNSLRGGGGGFNPLGELQAATGIDRLRILGGDDASGRGTALAAGKYLTDDVYIEIITDARGFTATQLEVTLTPFLSALSSFGSFGGSNVSVQYKKDY